MTAVDSYWRKLDDVTNNLENSIAISSILLKLKEQDDKINNIEANKDDITSNSIRIEQNEDNIISILPSLKIFDEKYNIENQEFNFDRNTSSFKILETEIEDNFTKYGMLNIKSNIYYKYDNLKKDMYRSCHKYQFYNNNTLFYEMILNNYNFGTTDYNNNIFYIKDDFYVKIKNNYNKIKIILSLARAYPTGTVSYNLKHINSNSINIIYLDKNNISLKIDGNETDIASNLKKIEKMRDTIVDKTYTISDFSKSGNKIFEINFDNDFTNKGILKIKANYTYNFSRIYNFYSNNNIFKVVSLDNKTDEFEIETINSSQIKISIHLVDATIKLYDGTIQIKYEDTNDYKINTNINDITSNLKKIKTNETEINSLKKSRYLKKIYNIPFFNEEKLIKFNEVFFEKIFNVKASINDFIEIQFMFDLQANNAFKLIDNVKLEYKILDNDTSLYSKEIKLIDKYKYSSDYIYIKEYVFYNFSIYIEKIKFVINFNTIFNEPNKLFYLNNDNRLILKHYGL